MSRIIIIFVLASFVRLSAQQEVIESPFISPVKHGLRLSGTFGELRNDHFHAGLDIRSSKGVAGDPIIAIGDGFISRIKVEMGGYGNTLYIEHPSGQTSVYAHLHTFRQDINEIVLARQYELKSFEIDIELDSLALPISQGDSIGSMGNSGFSFGPHLHFEIRDTKTQVPENPMSYGIAPLDDKAPVISGIRIHHLNPNGSTLSTEPIELKKTGQGYTAINPTLSIAAWRIGFSIKVSDSQNGSSNKNGIYSIELKTDNTTIYHFRATHCGFDETHQMNAHIDYPAKQAKLGFWHRCHKLPGNTLSMYEKVEELGHIPLSSGEPVSVEIIVRDFAGNQTRFKTSVIRNTNIEPTPGPIFNAWLKYDKANFYEGQGARLFIPEEGLYEDLPFAYQQRINESNITLELGKKHQLLKKKARFECDLSLLPLSNLFSKYALVYLDHRKYNEISAGGMVVDSFFRVNIHKLGRYILKPDTIKPTITPLRWKSSYALGETVHFRIKDNVQVFGEARELIIQASVNEQWVLAQYDLKNHHVLLPIDSNWPKGQVLLKITAMDDRMNKATWSKLVEVN